MARSIEAVYENGVFKPLQPVKCEEGQRVQLYIPYEPTGWTAEQIEEEMRETHRICGELTNAEWDEISQSWKRGQ